MIWLQKQKKHNYSKEKNKYLSEVFIIVEPSQLEKALQKAWCKETSSDPANWTAKNPAWGQCAISALLINDYFGGKIVFAEALLPNGTKISHYFNFINEMEIDITREQFPPGTIIPTGVDKTKGFSTTRDYVLSYLPTKERYMLLKDKLQKLLD